MNFLNRQNYRKLYVQLYEKLRKKIEDKEWSVGTQIPTEQELCKLFNVSRATVRSAISELVRHGYLIRQQGKGTFVSKKIVSGKLNMFITFGEIMLDEEVDFSTEVLAQTILMPIDDLQDKLRVSGDRHIIYIKRLRKIDNKPFMVQESYIPFHICPQLLEEDIQRNSLFELFEKKYGIQITRVRSLFDVIYFNTDEVKILGLSETSPTLLLNQHFFSGETLIMYMRSIKKPGSFELSMEFERKTGEM
ncbi:MAG: GntR family transcriptional regulator [Thermodesulfovibrionales bacterium]